MDPANSRSDSRPLRVLCIDGGGMRGIYTAAFLDELCSRYAQHRGTEGGRLDLGAGFDLLVGTSTGGILATAIARGLPPSTILKLFLKDGPRVFPVKVPTEFGLSLLMQLFTRSSHLRAGDAALEQALEEVFGRMSLGELYERRRIALAIPAIDMTTHRAWVFKTPHLSNSIGRDNKYRLVDILKATSAAPIFRSLAAVDSPDGVGYQVFADGGLYANSPVMVALIDALQMTDSGDPVEIYGLGTCKRPAGSTIGRDAVHRGFLGWAFGGRAAELALDSQEHVSWEMARLISRHIDRDVQLIRFPRSTIAVDRLRFLDLDETSDQAANALIGQARSDVQETLARCADAGDTEGVLLNSLLMGLPEMNDSTESAEVEK